MRVPHVEDPAVTAMTRDPAAYFPAALARARRDARAWVRAELARRLHRT